MKKKPSGVFRAQLVAIGFKQEEGTNYSNDDKLSPVIAGRLITIVMVFIVLANWSASITDVEGAFLHGSFQNKNEKVFIKVQLGLQELYPLWVLLLLLVTICFTGLGRSACILPSI